MTRNGQSEFFENIKVGIAEFFGTAILVFMTCTACLPETRGESNRFQNEALVSGLAVMTAVFLFGHISGAFVNPATTVCAVILEMVPLKRVPTYLLAQILGGIAGYGVTISLLPQNVKYSLFSQGNICVTQPSVQLTLGQAIIVEFATCIILMFANCSSWDYINQNKQDSMALKFGFLVFGMVTSCGSLCGAVMNPARSFGPAFWNNNWKGHWIYWVTPITAAVLVSILYKTIFLRNK